MSGPMAASFGIEAGVLVAAAAIAQGAAEIAAGMAEAEQRAEAARRQRRAERRQMRAAREAGLEKRRQAGEQRLARLHHLRAAWERFGQDAGGLEPPAAPAASGDAAHAAWLAALDALIARLEAGLADLAEARGGELAASLRALLAGGVAAADQLDTFLAQARLAGASEEVAAQRRALVERVLERLALAVDEPLPAEFDALALDIVQAPTTERADALATELRLRVQRHNETRAAAEEQRKLREAAAVVLEQSLKDLGYAIEEIEETLFVEGGVAHFQRPEWGDYFVRLRIDPQRGAMNFNVVRAGTAGEDRKHEDMLAEERWCAAFPKLFETLKARGIPITVTRLLQAGEAPVQVVDAATLPQRATEERRHEPLKARSIE